MKVLLLTEGGEGIGLGHITRCLSIAHAFQRADFEIQFCVNQQAAESPVFEGVPVLAAANEQDYLAAARAHSDADIFLVDSYLLPEPVYRQLADLPPCLMCIDDFGRLPYPADVLLNPTVGAENLEWGYAVECLTLLGVRYMPLRPAFWNVPSRRVYDRIGSVLVTLGGFCKKEMLDGVLDVVRHSLPEARVACVSAALTENGREQDSHVQYYNMVGDEQMSGLLREADLVVTACGQTTYECARVGTPMVGIGLADNQRFNIEGWQKSGVLTFAGWGVDPALPDNVSRAIASLEAPQRRQEVAAKGCEIVDGQGALRIVDRLVSLVGGNA